ASSGGEKIGDALHVAARVDRDREHRHDRRHHQHPVNPVHERMKVSPQLGWRGEGLWQLRMELLHTFWKTGEQTWRSDDISPAWPGRTKPRGAAATTQDSSDPRPVRQATPGEQFLPPAGPSFRPRFLAVLRKTSTYKRVVSSQ